MPSSRVMTSGAADEATVSSLLSRFGGVLTSVGSTIGTIVGFGYFGVCALAFTFQRKLQYFPTKEPPPPVSALPPVCRGIEECTVRTEDGETLQAWYWPAIPGGKHSKITLLQLHGNAGSRHNRLYWAHHMRTRLGVGVALLDYRGYGGSTGRITEAGMIMDGVAGITWAATKAAESGSKLVLHLESIGSAAGVAAAARLSPDSGVSGIVVEGGLSSCVELAKNIFSFIPVGLLMKDKWAGTCAAAAALEPDVPFMSMHGDRDEIVPLWCGRKLFDAVRGVKVWREFKRGGHNNLIEKHGYFESLDEFYTEHVS